MPAKGKATGSGAVQSDCGLATFSFVVQRKQTGGAATGNLTYVDQNAGVNLKAVSFTTFGVTTTATGKAADFSGTCTNNGVACTFTVHIEDNSEPGAADVFEITTSFGYSDGGVIRSGNIQIF